MEFRENFQTLPELKWRTNTAKSELIIKNSVVVQVTNYLLQECIGYKVGMPKETTIYSMSELISMGYVGLYN